MLSVDIRKVPVYYIGRPGEINHELENLLSSHGFGPVTKLNGVFEANKKTGVAKAHMNALAVALSECDGPFLILEEDVDIFNKNMAVSVPEDADAVYLGLSTWGLKNGRGENWMVSAQKFNGGLYKVYNMLAAHAVLYVNHDYAQFLLNHIPTFIKMATNQDKLRAETMKYWDIYALSHPIFYQQGLYKKHTYVKLSQIDLKPLSLFYR